MNLEAHFFRVLGIRVALRLLPRMGYDQASHALLHGLGEKSQAEMGYPGPRLQIDPSP